MTSKADNFPEIEYIKDDKLKKFAVLAIETLPDYFFHMPSSTTGKYHPEYALGDGGLLRHTRAAMRIALELFRMNDMFTQEEQDLILCSLALHDGWKKGVSGNEHTVFQHPLVAASEIEKNFSVSDYITERQMDIVTGCIKTHMGRWTKDRMSNMEVLEPPHTIIQRFVHMCDYLASRKTIEVKFDVELSK